VNALLIRPSLKLIKTTIQKTIGFRIEWYDMRVNLMDEKIDFVVPVDMSVRVYPYGDKQGLLTIIKNLLKDKITSGESIQVAIIKHRNEKSCVEIYYSDSKGNKQFKIEEL